MKIIHVFFLLLFCSVTLAQENSIPYVQSEISIDGNLDESAWNNLTEISNFYNYMPTDVGRSEYQTKVKLFHNGKYLYLSAIYYDTEARIQTSSLKRDVSIGLSDSFILILDTQNQQQSAYYFAVNSYGTQVDGLVERINEGYDFSLSWNAVWQARTSVNGNQKIYEMAIPLKALNYSEKAPTFGIQMYTRDIKKNAWSILTNVKRNYRLFDLRFTTPFVVDQIPDRSPSRVAITSAITTNYQQNIAENTEKTSFIPSMDVQYNLTSSLKLDATINPDFSQVDVDQQVTNLSRFSIFFPERRNFFLENADLFSNLGVSSVNPFYSRRIGANSDIGFGLKLSGNLTSTTRSGLMSVQTTGNENTRNQNYSAIVLEQQLNNNFTATGFLINRQETQALEFKEDYNRVTGININFKSNNNRWIGLANLAKSLSNGIEDKNNFYNLGMWYNRRGLSGSLSIRNLGSNYLTDVGFTPRLFNYDAINQVTIREGYSQLSSQLEYELFFEKSDWANSIRVLNYRNNTFFNESGEISQYQHYFNSAIFFKNLSAIYYVLTYDNVRLDYGFDPIGSGNPILPGDYRFALLKIGYNSANNQKIRYRVNAQKGSYYLGDRTSAGLYINYQLLPFANIELAYDINQIDLKELGERTLHLTRFTGEVFINTRLNWTSYVQYNTQFDNFNINTRLQWEYKPLSYLYIVFTDNYNQDIQRKDWGLAFKINYRMDL